MNKTPLKPFPVMMYMVIGSLFVVLTATSCGMPTPDQSKSVQGENTPITAPTPVETMVDNPTPPLLETSAGACTQADKTNYIYRTNRDFARKWEECGRSSWGNSADAANCIKIAYPRLSMPCVNCFGDYVACTKSACFWPCAFGSASSCETCAHENCLEGLASCTGVRAGDIPSKY